ncbi:MAG TPA: hypothetical protein VGV93_01245 [Acidimicrobiales bacterium]|nr:hypothetical protein [Acidimicrobiales bacterium]
MSRRWQPGEGQLAAWGKFIHQLSGQGLPEVLGCLAGEEGGADVRQGVVVTLAPLVRTQPKAASRAHRAGVADPTDLIEPSSTSRPPG